MRWWVPIVVGCHWAAILLAGSAAANEEFAELRGDDRWLPGVAGFGGLIIQESNAGIESTPRGLQQGDSLAVFAHVGLSAEVMTPSLGSSLWAPRLFVHADAARAFDSEESVANEGAPGQIQVPIIDNNSDGIPDFDPPLLGIVGRGSATKAETEPWVFSAGVGVAFTLEAWGRPLRLKPSLEWLHTETRAIGIVGDAQTLDGGDQCPCRTALVSAEQTEGFHYLGAGLEVELDAARAGPLVLSVFGGGGGYHILGDRDIQIRASGSYTEPAGPPVETLSFHSTYQLDSWHYRIAFGLRFRWHPE